MVGKFCGIFKIITFLPTCSLYLHTHTHTHPTLGLLVSEHGFHILVNLPGKIEEESLISPLMKSPLERVLVNSQSWLMGQIESLLFEL